MAIIKCHECGKDVSTEAKNCPGCGAKVKKQKKPVGIVGIAFTVLIGFIVFSVVSGTKRAEEQEAARQASLTPQQKQAEEAKKIESKNRLDAAYLCLDGAKDSLKDPDSAKFPDVNEVIVEKKKDGSYHAQFRGRAKNSFGAYMPSVFDCKISVSPSGEQHLAAVKELN